MTAVRGLSNDPYFNLATEEYMLSETEDDVFMLWQNDLSVIIGKNQNAWSEINSAYTEKNGIKIARRMTGGGAVFHDLGNVNFTFITDASKDNTMNFKLFTSPIIDALGEMGIDARLDGRNDLVAGGFKISGNAECVAENKFSKKRILHHGTLLFSSDMRELSASLNVSKSKLNSKGIKSVRSRVSNITSIEGYKGPLRVDGFIDELFSKISLGKKRFLTPDEICGVQKLCDAKYSRPEWIWGTPFEFDYKSEKRFPFGTVQCEAVCKKGIIQNIRITGDFFGTGNISEIETALTGILCNREKIREALLAMPLPVYEYIKGASCEDIAALAVPDGNNTEDMR